MSEDDIKRWDRKYRSDNRPGDDTPDSELIRYRAKLPASGLALDLACGAGKNTVYLAQQGLKVMAIDGSMVALNRLRNEAKEKGLLERVQLQQVDLDRVQLPTSTFELIVVVRYLNHALFEDIRRALKPGGVLFYKTFNRNILRKRPKFNARYTIETDALIAAFSGWEVLADNRDSPDAETAFVMLRMPV